MALQQARGYREPDRVGAGAAERAPRRELAPRHGVVALLFALLLAAAAAGGPDYSRYEDWALAGLSGDLSGARVYTISPMGIPLMMWSHGAGFVFATAQLASGGLLDVRSSAMLAGWLVTLALWAALLRVLWLAARGDPALTLLGASLLLLATHGGYFSHVHASESLALACTGILVWVAFDRRAAGPCIFLAAGLTIAFLLTIKPHWVLYGTGTMAVLLLRARHAGRGVGRMIGWTALAAGPVAVAVVQVALTNRWMTGSVLRSSYHFGDARFSSFDFADPELAAVLLHPWHGLLSYHPFYFLGGLAVAFVALRGARDGRRGIAANRGAAGPRRPVDDGAGRLADNGARADLHGHVDREADLEMRVFFALSAVAMLVNLYIQAAWVVWWLGRATFGMRGMAPAAAVVVPAFIVVAGRLTERRSPWLWAWVGAAMACALWSTTLLLTGVEPQFYTYGQMLAGQLATLRGLTLSGVAAAAAFWLLLAWLLRDTWRAAAPRRAMLALASLALIALAGAYFLGAGMSVIDEIPPMRLAAALLLVLGVPATLAARHLGVGGSPEPLTVLVVLGTASFVLASALFFRLAARVEDDIAAGRRPPHNYAYVNTFSTRDMRDSCNEYRHLPEFQDKREAFKAFLIRHGVAPTEFRC